MTREEILYCLKADSVGYMENCEQCTYGDKTDAGTCYSKHTLAAIKALEAEPLTDIEQLIFLSAMAREEEAYSEVYANGENIDLVAVCRNIKKKVKRVLWK